MLSHSYLSLIIFSIINMFTRMQSILIQIFQNTVNCNIKAKKVKLSVSVLQIIRAMF